MSIENLVQEIRQHIEDATIFIAPLARTRMTTFGLEPQDVFDAIRDGDAYPAREKDRVKFMLGDVIVFVAVGNAQAWVVAAYPLTTNNR